MFIVYAGEKLFRSLILNSQEIKLLTISDNIILNNMALETCDLLDPSLLEDDITMPLPSFESHPDLLISKVRKHYMEYVIKLLTSNYETHQKLVSKNIYLPSAIWTCAKNIETAATQACMVAQLYRKNIITVVNELKTDTKKGKLNKKLLECLSKAPVNSKKTQTSNTFKDTSNCQCAHNKRKRHIMTESPQHVEKQLQNLVSDNLTNICVPTAMNLNYNYIHTYPPITCDTIPLPIDIQPEGQTMMQVTTPAPMPIKRMSEESQDSDELMMKLEKLFEGETNDDDLFEGALYDRMDPFQDEQTKKNNFNSENNINNTIQEAVIENHSVQIKLLDERLANLAGLLVSNDHVPQKTETQETRKHGHSKWLCEEYYLKQNLYELLDQIGDTDRKKLEKIKEKFAQLFGYDSEDEGVLSPLEETPEFKASCKERIAPWVVKLLTPLYKKAHIKGKGTFKALVKHLLRVIYQCSRYPEEYEVASFVSDFLKNHKTISCEADFKEFKIENI